MQLRKGINRGLLPVESVRFDSSEVFVLPDNQKNVCFELATINDIRFGVNS